MRITAAAILTGCLLGVPAWGNDEFFDRLGDALIFSSTSGNARAQLSGTMDLEFYRVQSPAPGLIFTPDNSLFSPRLTVFLDAEIGNRVYFFAQGRADRGFDPARGGIRGRLDEYAVRFTPVDGGRFSIQAGKFATVVGSWVPRHGSWENPFVTAPLPYEHLTGIWDSAAAPSGSVLLAWAHVLPRVSASAEYADKHLRVPVIWGPGYSSGVAIFGEIGNATYGVEVKNAAPSVSPEGWSYDRISFEHPTVSARVTYNPNLMWRVGMSASSGSYLLPSAAPTVARGFGLGDYRQTVIGQEVSFAWHHWQVWLETFQSRFEIPRVGNADTFAGYAEVKYKFTPRFSGALRWNQQTFGTIPTKSFGSVNWGRDIWRLDVAPAWRFSPHMQLKVQFSLQRESGAAREDSRVVAGQFTVRF